MVKRRNLPRWRVPAGEQPTALDLRVMEFEANHTRVPTRDMIKTPEQISGIRLSGLINTALLDYIESVIRVGMTTAELDRLAYDFTLSRDATPAPLNYEGFPKSICTSINEVVCHGVPNDFEVLQDGDIINVDVSTIFKGYYSDASRMFMLGAPRPDRERLVRVAKECLEIGAAAARPWGVLGDVGRAIESHAVKNGYSVVRDLCGHGIGLEFHEEPEVDHYKRRAAGMLLVPGMVFTIEPMINMGVPEVFIDADDGWSVVTEDEKPSAQWEHTFLVTETGLEILSH